MLGSIILKKDSKNHRFNTTLYFIIQKVQVDNMQVLGLIHPRWCKITWPCLILIFIIIYRCPITWRGIMKSVIRWWRFKWLYVFKFTLLIICIWNCVNLILTIYHVCFQKRMDFSNTEICNRYTYARIKKIKKKTARIIFLTQHYIS